ncbi:Smr/MutS family protein [Legionella fairfieldensis]|uniref:Smr/MutS family protein n=1 Tax=Legionella fairfieldensis TaxID=45064 RepID=UPI000491C207|nr:Smr/MutS family protein [Legionella fairfieldensis]
MPKNFLSEQDKALFREMMKDVKPLQENKKIFTAPETLPVRKKSNDRVMQKRTKTIYLSDYYQEEVQSDTILSYCSHSIPATRLRELRKGQIPYQGKLDLHGLKPDSARDSLIKFIAQQNEKGHRCLLIIHGKGGHRGEAPILKNLVNHWLPQFSQVLAFHSALAHHGGCGALYVLLKRNNQSIK